MKPGRQEGGIPGQCRRDGRKMCIKVDYKSRPGATGGIPRTVQKGRRKGGYKSSARGGMLRTVQRKEGKAAIKVVYKSRPGARGGMPRTVQMGRRQGGYKSRL